MYVGEPNTLRDDMDSGPQLARQWARAPPPLAHMCETGTGRWLTMGAERRGWRSDDWQTNWDWAKCIKTTVYGDSQRY